MTKLADIAGLRLRNQRLLLADESKFRSPEEVVGWLGAVQSQEYALARWSVGMRMVERSRTARRTNNRAAATGGVSVP